MQTITSRTFRHPGSETSATLRAIVDGDRHALEVRVASRKPTLTPYPDLDGVRAAWARHQAMLVRTGYVAA
jgi:hypothetical protein